MRSSSQILHGDQTSCEGKLYRVDHAPSSLDKMLVIGMLKRDLFAVADLLCCCHDDAQMYYEAKSVNTQLMYRYRQLERVKASLEMAWTAHKRLHQAAGLDVPEVDGSPLRTSDALGSSPATSRALSLCQSVSVLIHSAQSDDEATLLSVQRCATEPSTTSQFSVAADDSNCWNWNDPLSYDVRQEPLSSRQPYFSSAASERPNNTELRDCRNESRREADIFVGDLRQVTFPQQPSSRPLHRIDRSAVVQSSSDVFDDDDPFVDLLTWRAADYVEPSLLFDGDDWWTSDQSCSCQCGSHVSAVESPTQRTPTEIQTATSSPPTSTHDLSSLQLSPVYDNFQQQQLNFIPLHVQDLADTTGSNY